MKMNTDVIVYKSWIPTKERKDIRINLTKDKKYLKKVSDSIDILTKQNCYILGEEKERKYLSKAICIELICRNKNQAIFIAQVNDEFNWKKASDKIEDYYGTFTDDLIYFVIEDCHNNVEEVKKFWDELSSKNIPKARFIFTLHKIEPINVNFLNGCYKLDLHPNKTLAIDMPTFFKELCDEYESRKKENKILIVGDVMLDHKMEGVEPNLNEVHNHRLDVFMVDGKEQEHKTLGGAADIAWAFSKVSIVTLIGVIGKDCEGNTLEKLCKDADIVFLPVKADVLTTTKIYMSCNINGTVKIVRFDREDKKLMKQQCDDVRKEIINNIEKAAESGIDCIVLKDHEKGMISEFIVKTLSRIAYEKKIPLFVDPKYSWEIFKDVEIKAMLPNIKEASYGIFGNARAKTGIIQKKISEHTFEDDDYQKLIDNYPQCKDFIIKADENGAVILIRNEDGWNIKEFKPLNIYKSLNCVGCGDVFDAFAIIGILHNHSLEESVLFANFVAGLRVKKLLGGVMSPDEIKKKLDKGSAFINAYFEDNKKLVETILKDVNT